jgi:multiple sugar transport system substrate-binding protein
MRKKYSRRSFLKMTGAGLAGASLLGTAGCGGSGASFSSSAEMWKQFMGTTFNFVSEYTAPTPTIAANLNGFKELTRINVNVLQLELGALVQKVALDIGSGEGAYQIVYADPYQIMAPYHDALADLGEFDSDDNLPSIPKGTDDFITTQLNTQTGLNWGQLSAIGTIVVLPMMIVGLAVRRYLVKGLTLGAVMGE